MPIKFDFKGFDMLIEKIREAGENAERYAEQTARKAAEIYDEELRKSMRDADGSFADLIDRMPPPEITNSGDRFTVRVGYKKGKYDPENPSDAYKVIFLNYGTPRRTKHGTVKALHFIDKAKKKAKMKISREFRQMQTDIMKGLK